jgi:4-hydroxythreonine-4-phosphate dehydrogenase
MNKVTLVITPGDPRGIGPEVTKKAIAALWKELKSTNVLIFGKKFSVSKKIAVKFIEPPPGSSSGFQSGWAIQSAAKYVLNSKTKTALVTGPIHKASFQGSGFNFNGHTDYLASLSKSKNAVMVLANEWFKVALITNHCPLSEVSKNITQKKIIETVEEVAKFCRTNLKKKMPKIAILGLNPHAGEDGILGREETEIIIPAMKQLTLRSKKSKKKLILTGPHPADSFFAMEKNRVLKKKGHDFIIAQYHDQGLIPVKLSDFSNGLNLTLGLPFIRTSVDHGTAFDIAGKNKADPSSMIYAIRKAIEYL